MQLEGQLKRAHGIVVFRDPGDELLAGYHGWLIIVYAAEDQGSSGRDAVTVTRRELQRGIVHGYDQIKLEVGILCCQQLCQVREVFFRMKFLGVQMFQVQVEAWINPGKTISQLGHFIFPPVVAYVVGVEDKNAGNRCRRMECGE